MSTVTLQERLRALSDPPRLLSIAVYCFLYVLFDTVFNRKQYAAPFTNFSDIRGEAFGKFLGIITKQPPGAGQEQLVGSAALIPPMLAQADGVVLDIGPGTGAQCKYFTNPNVKKVYGAEPCVAIHNDLRANVRGTAVDGKYDIVNAGGEAVPLYRELNKAGVLPEAAPAPVFDTITAVRCFCSISDPVAVINGLYPLLKPGGKFIMVEHVKNDWHSPKGSILARFVQIIIQTLGFPFFVGNCHFNRETVKTIDRAAVHDGGWESAEVERHFSYAPLCYATAVFVKRNHNKKA